MSYERMTADQIGDRIEINDLLVRYAAAIDAKDYNLLDTCFTPDAKVDYTSSAGIAGTYPEARAWLEKALAMFSMTLHYVTNSTVTLDGDSARATTYVFNPMRMKNADGSASYFTVGAYYHDRLVRTQDGWRIAERREELAFMEGSLPAGLEEPS